MLGIQTCFLLSVSPILGAMIDSSKFQGEILLAICDNRYEAHFLGHHSRTKSLRKYMTLCLSSFVCLCVVNQCALRKRVQVHLRFFP